jgi:hypothetical protein
MCELRPITADSRARGIAQTRGTKIVRFASKDKNTEEVLLVEKTSKHVSRYLDTRPFYFWRPRSS